MDSKFIITREYRALRPGDLFAWFPCSPFIRRFISTDGSICSHSVIRSYDRDVYIPSSSSGFARPFGYICKPR